MSNLRRFEPRLFEPVLGEPFESIFKRFMAPLRMEIENGSLDMQLAIQ